MDDEFIGRKPAKGPHEEVVGALVVNSELFCKVIQGLKAVAGVKPFLILPVAALHLVVMTWCVRTNELMPDTQLGNSGLKQDGQVMLAVGKTVGELKSIVRLDTLHADTSASIPLEQLFQKTAEK